MSNVGPPPYAPVLQRTASTAADRTNPSQSGISWDDPCPLPLTATPIGAPYGANNAVTWGRPDPGMVWGIQRVQLYVMAPVDATVRPVWLHLSPDGHQNIGDAAHVLGQWTFLTDAQLGAQFLPWDAPWPELVINEGMALIGVTVSTVTALSGVAWIKKGRIIS